MKKGVCWILVILHIIFAIYRVPKGAWDIVERREFYESMLGESAYNKVFWISFKDTILITVVCIFQIILCFTNTSVVWNFVLFVVSSAGFIALQFKKKYDLERSDCHPLDPECN